MSEPHKKSIFVIGGNADSLLNFRGPMLAGLVQKGYDVFALSPHASHDVVTGLNEMGVTHLEIPFHRAGLNVFCDLKACCCLIRAMKRFLPHIVISYTMKPVIYGSLCSKFSGVESIYSIITGLGYVFTGTTWKKRFLRLIVGGLNKISLRFNTAVFFQNPDDLRFFTNSRILQSGEKAILINGSGVDLAHYAPAPLPANPSFLMIGRFLHDKGIMEYIDAARLVKRCYPDIQFSLVGWIDFENPSCIKQEVLQSCINEGLINYLGRLEDVRPSIRECSVFVLPSYREGTPRSVLEAMAMGRMIITTDAPGCRETVEDGVNGFLVPVGDAFLLAKKMEYVINNPSLLVSMGRESRRIAQSKYCVNKVNQSIFSSMKSL